MKNKIEKAIKYAESTSMIENMNPTKEELKTIKQMLENPDKKQILIKIQKKEEKKGKIK